MRPLRFLVLRVVFFGSFGPYLDLTQGERMRPPGNGPASKISSLRRPETLSSAGNLLEVLAGAISWGFKSPSPHHILSDLAV